jgi:hypothetical protein
MDGLYCAVKGDALLSASDLLLIEHEEQYIGILALAASARWSSTKIAAARLSRARAPLATAEPIGKSPQAAAVRIHE